MRDPPAKNKQKIKEPTAKLLFHLLKFGCFVHVIALIALITLIPLIPLIPDYSNTWRSLCEEKFTELVKKLEDKWFLGYLKGALVVISL